MKSPKAPKKTAEQVSVERRQQFMLDEEIEETESRLKAVGNSGSGGTSGPRTFTGGSSNQK